MQFEDYNYTPDFLKRGGFVSPVLQNRKLPTYMDLETDDIRKFGLKVDISDQRFSEAISHKRYVMVEKENGVDVEKIYDLPGLMVAALDRVTKVKTKQDADEAKVALDDIARVVVKLDGDGVDLKNIVNVNNAAFIRSLNIIGNDLYRFYTNLDMAPLANAKVVAKQLRLPIPVNVLAGPKTIKSELIGEFKNNFVDALESEYGMLVNTLDSEEIKTLMYLYFNPVNTGRVHGDSKVIMSSYLVERRPMIAKLVGDNKLMLYRHRGARIEKNFDVLQLYLARLTKLISKVPAVLASRYGDLYKEYNASLNSRDVLGNSPAFYKAMLEAVRLLI